MPVPYNYCVISKFEHHGRIDNRKLSGLVSRGWCIAHGDAHRCNAAPRRDIALFLSPSLSLYCYKRAWTSVHLYMHAHTCFYEQTNWFCSSLWLQRRWTHWRKDSANSGATKRSVVRYDIKKIMSAYGMGEVRILTEDIFRNKFFTVILID